ncbi:unnamed protein product [Zymoseptoria tritici ST99CH_1A5]|uniref:Uncharacterized protein n=1 Tax=Zymoseptoria tritici ST99CH_1A5 TaxID=1276529 RepID=A0A1Y6LSC0_ZYMTR|nr:unnamed protein product [Zymoseptoria tritici ST99CH_3D1]SMY27287.1 unnamed protein product [Zymoseptoria tritici ST99CH_1A5]
MAPTDSSKSAAGGSAADEALDGLFSRLTIQSDTTSESSNALPDEIIMYGPFPLDANGYCLFKPPSHPIHNLYGKTPTWGPWESPPARPPPPFRCRNWQCINGKNQPPDYYCPDCNPTGIGY